jgi:hypothetical protein
MKLTVSVIVRADDEDQGTAHEVLSLERSQLAPGNLGLRIDEAKELLAAVQDELVSEQARAAIAEQVACPSCGSSHRHKDSREIVVHSLFGTLRLTSPRWWQCSCSAHDARTFSPLAALLPERARPELQYLEAKFAGLVSYGLSAKLLAEVLPLGRPLHPTVLRRHAQAVAQHLEDELGEERWSFIEGCQRDWEELPRPDMPLTVSLDGGFVHSAEQTSRRDGWFEVIAGRSVPDQGPAKSFGFVQTYDDKPKRRLFELLTSQGMQANQQVTFITDGGQDVRELPLYLNPQAEHVIDWFHITMKLTVLGQMAKGLARAHEAKGALPDEPGRPDGAEDIAAVASKELERLKWYLWHGNVFRALQVVDDLETDLEAEDPSPEQQKFVKALAELGNYVRANASWVPNYGERYRAGEAISSSLAESAVNQVVSKRMVKKQQMRWSPRGAHLLLQVRTRVLNDDLAADFRRWHPGFAHQPEPVATAA